jgi:L-serine deaminase
MSLSNLPFFPQSINTVEQTIANSDAQTVKTILTAGTNGSKVSMLQATSTDTTARDVILYITISSTNYQIGQISLPITAGAVDSTPTVNLLNSSQLQLPVDANGNPFLYLGNGASLTVNAPVTVTSGKTITLLATREDY